MDVGLALGSPPDAVPNPSTLKMGAFEGDLGEPVSKVCGDVLHFLHEGGFYVSES